MKTVGDGVGDGVRGHVASAVNSEETTKERTDGMTTGVDEPVGAVKCDGHAVQAETYPWPRNGWIAGQISQLLGLVNSDSENSV